MVIIVSPPQTRPLRPLHGESSYPDQFHQGPLVW